MLLSESEAQIAITSIGAITQMVNRYLNIRVNWKRIGIENASLDRLMADHTHRAAVELSLIDDSVDQWPARLYFVFTF